jgi:predicted aspartyl protease
MAPNGEMNKRRKPFQSRRTVQAIVVAVALHVVGFLFILYMSGHFTGAKETVVPSPEGHRAEKPELADRDAKKAGDEPRSAHTLKPPPPRSGGQAGQNVYCWTDENGVSNFSNLAPPSHVTNFETRKMPANHPRSNETRVIIKANQVILPVRLGYMGQEVVTYLLLDTGASTTVLNRRVADQLNIRSARPGVARVADGRSIPVYSVDMDYIVVGPHKISNLAANLIEHQGKPEPFDGLLGMNFLREVNYHVDFNRQVISWARFE